jgi:hypothetical protein
MILAVLIVTAVFLTACNVSMAGGIAGGSLGTLLLLVLFLGGSATTQAGCAEDTGENERNTVDIGPCLTPGNPWDTGTIEEDMGTDQGVDSGSDAGSSMDAGSDAGSRRDAGSGMDAGSDAGADATMGALSPDDRSRLREKYRDRLPADVLARLDDDEMV